jgi:hypothetical protein
MNLSFAFRLLSSVFCRLSSVTELALFFRGPKTANFSYSFYIKELTTILTLQKLALFCKKKLICRILSTNVEQTMATSAMANSGIFDFCTVILHFDF